MKLKNLAARQLGRTTHRIPARLLTLLLAPMLSLVLLTSAMAEGFDILSAKARFDHSQLRVDAQLGLELSPEVEEAVNKGIPVTILVNLLLYKVRNVMIWDSEIANWQFPYQLQYHALTRHYLLKYPHSDRVEAYPTISEALKALTHFSFESEVISETLPKSKRGYKLAMQVTLDVESLPAPLRVMATVLPSWRLKSSWFEWRMQP